MPHEGRTRGRRASHLARRALSLALCLPALGVPLAGCQPTRPPNLVLVIIDTLRADKLHSYGFPRPTSPELDAPAQRGVRFARVSSELAAYLDRWESAHPKARPALQHRALSPEESEQLRALGYLP
jgi:hypothetical protein